MRLLLREQRKVTLVSFASLSILLLPALSFGACTGHAVPQNPGLQSQGRRVQVSAGIVADGAGGAMMSRDVMGTVTEIAPEHFTVKTENGDIYTVHYSVNTRIMKSAGAAPRQGGNKAATTNRLPTRHAHQSTDIR